MANYIDKEEMLGEILVHRTAYLKAKNEGIDPPSVTNSLMKKFMMITDGIARRPNFNGYSFLDEMKSTANMMCLRKAHYFDPEKSNNAFGFFSRVIWREFLNVIAAEEKQSYVKAKTFYNFSDGVFDSLAQDKDIDVNSEGFSVPFFDVEEYERKNAIENSINKKQKKMKNLKGPLSYLEEEDELYQELETSAVEEIQKVIDEIAGDAQ